MQVSAKRIVLCAVGVTVWLTAQALPSEIRQITLFDRQGRVVRTVGEPGPYLQPTLSPDGARVAVVRTDPNTRNQDIWTLDASTGKATPVTSDSAPDSSPVWSPDGSQVAYVSTRENSTEVYRRAWTGVGTEDLLYRHTQREPVILTDWSADGEFLSFSVGGTIYLVPLNGGNASARKATELVSQGTPSLPGGQFSPDSSFLAYLSNQSGRNEIFVRRLNVAPGQAGLWQVSKSGAIGVVLWRADGKELSYMATNSEVMTVDLTATPGFRAGTPRLLFRTKTPVVVNPPLRRTASRDGQRFAFAVPVAARAR